MSSPLEERQAIRLPREDSAAGAETGVIRTRAGLAFAVLAAASGALLLFLPVMLIGYTFSVLATIIGGQHLAWQSVVLLSYALVGIPALLSLGLLVIPYSLMQAAGRRLGIRLAAMWVGGLLLVWHAGLAAIWAWDATRGFRRMAAWDDLSYPLAFGMVAVAILLGAVVDQLRVRRPFGRDVRA